MAQRSHFASARARVRVCVEDTESSFVLFSLFPLSFS